VDTQKILQDSLLDERFVLTKDLPDGERVQFARFIDFAGGWREGTRVVNEVDPDGAYSLWEMTPAGSRRRARFASSRLTLKSVRRGQTMLALAVVE
jgi:hypothetical protein